MDQKLIEALTQQHISFDDANVTLALTQREPTQIADLREQPASAVNEIILGAGFRALLLRAKKRYWHAGGTPPYARDLAPKYRRLD